jgi:hypothetical protein
VELPDLAADVRVLGAQPRVGPALPDLQPPHLQHPRPRRRSRADQLRRRSEVSVWILAPTSGLDWDSWDWVGEGPRSGATWCMRRLAVDPGKGFAFFLFQILNAPRASTGWVQAAPLVSGPVQPVNIIKRVP